MRFACEGLGVPEPWYRARSYPTESRTPPSVLTLPVVSGHSGHGLAHPQDPRSAPASGCASVCRPQSCLCLSQSLSLFMGENIFHVFTMSPSDLW